MTFMMLLFGFVQPELREFKWPCVWLTLGCCLLLLNSKLVQGQHSCYSGTIESNVWGEVPVAQANSLTIQKCFETSPAPTTAHSSAPPAPKRARLAAPPVPTTAHSAAPSARKRARLAAPSAPTTDHSGAATSPGTSSNPSTPSNPSTSSNSSIPPAVSTLTPSGTEIPGASTHSLATSPPTTQTAASSTGGPVTTTTASTAGSAGTGAVSTTPTAVPPTTNDLTPHPSKGTPSPAPTTPAPPPSSSTPPPPPPSSSTPQSSPASTTPSSPPLITTAATTAANVPQDRCAITRTFSGDKLKISSTFTLIFSCLSPDASCGASTTDNSTEVKCCTGDKCNNMRFLFSTMHVGYSTVRTCLNGTSKGTVDEVTCPATSHTNLCLNTTDSAGNVKFACESDFNALACLSEDNIPQEGCFHDKKTNTTVCCCGQDKCNGPPPQQHGQGNTGLIAGVIMAFVIGLLGGIVITVVCMKRRRNNAALPGELLSFDNFHYRRMAADETLVEI